MDESERPAFESTVAGEIPGSQKDPEIIAQRYKLIREIGRGGMGIVYLAHDQRLNRYVALKWLLETARSNIVQRRFLREARTIASLGHIHIVQVYDISKDGTRYFISMEYVPGPIATHDGSDNLPAPPMTLDRYIKVNGPMRPEAARNLIEKLCKALDYAHQSGIIHRDIKPANILLDPDLEPKLVDFGLARPIEASHSQEITQQGAVLGTPDYAAPEQMQDATSTDERVDVYSLAGVMWFAISAEVPRYFRESNVPDAYRPVVSKGLEKDRDKRYPSAREFYHALHQLDESTSRSTTSHSEGVGTETTSGLWICQNCMNHNSESAEYCVHCGTYGLVNCPACDHTFRSGIQFCPKCGLDTSTAKETIDVLQTAKQQAEFCEYESAIQTLREGGAESLDHSELGKMIKGWHQKMLQRRNLMTELDQAMHVYNLGKATELITELQQVMPMNCMMDSADYDCTIQFLEITDKFRAQLEDAVVKAQEDHNFAKYSEYVGYLVAVAGHEQCEEMVAELDKAQKELENAVTQAGLDLGVNCLSHAKEYLDAIPPWKGGELGDHRARLQKSCEESLVERDRSLDEAVEHVRRERYVEALGALAAGSKYCINMNKKDIRPAPEDKQANDSILEVDKQLMETLGRVFSRWLNNREWDRIQEMLEHLDGGSFSSWKRTHDKLKKLITEDLRKQFDKAVALEKKSRYSNAERIWKELLLTPSELLPSKYSALAEASGARRDLGLLKRRRVMCVMLSILLMVLWAYPVVPLVVEVVRGFAYETLDVQQLMQDYLFISIEGLLFTGLLVMSFLLPWTRHDTPFEYMRRISPRVVVLGVLAILSPLTMIIADMFNFYLPRHLAFMPQSEVAIFIYLGICWLLVDVAGQNGFKSPAAFAFTISWIVASIVASVGIHPAITTDWPAVAAVQVVVYLALHIGQATVCKMLPKPGEDVPKEGAAA